ncbi:MFS transporter [Nocardioides caeni]|uniref:MFS transporter n=1 Tax=Nocardioides caeni TaxID=574700 RepID=A0A4S8N3C8_9ACTN|nr:MFS transporter [Nocardioides caeni]THV10517.1 MFS transporter [Nocardioides caeni]
MTDPSQRQLVLTLCVAEVFLLGCSFSGATVALPVRIDDIRSSMRAESILGLTLAVGGLAAILSAPIFGWLSDRTYRTTGRRTPWIVGGTAAATLAQAALIAADSPAAMVLAWTATQLGITAAVSALYGAVPDLLGRAAWPQVAAWFAGSATGSIALGAGVAAVLPKEPVVLFTALPMVSLVVVAACALRLGRVSRARRRSLPARVRGKISAPDGFWRLWVQRLVAQSGWAATALFGVHLLERRAGLDTDSSATIVGIAGIIAALLGLLAAGLLARWIVAHVGYRPALVTGLSVIVLACIALSFTTSAPGYIAATSLAGIGVGIFNALDLTLVLHVLRAGEEGRFLGIFSVARTLPQSLVTAGAPVVLSIGPDLVGHDRSQNYWLLYTACAVLTACAILLVRRLPVPERT